MKYNRLRKLTIGMIIISIIVISVISVNSISSIASNRGSEVGTIQDPNAYIGVDSHNVKPLSNGTHTISVADLVNNFKNRDIEDIEVEILEDPPGPPRIIDIVDHPESLSLGESDSIDVKIHCNGERNTQGISLDIYTSDVVSTEIFVTETTKIKCQND